MNSIQVLFVHFGLTILSLMLTLIFGAIVGFPFFCLSTVWTVLKWNDVKHENDIVWSG